MNRNHELNNIVKYELVQGIITNVDYFYESDGTIKEGAYFLEISVGNEVVTFYLTEDTYYVDCNFQIGDYVFGYYRTDRPMILIYPPRYDIVVFGLIKENRNIKVDTFNQNLVSMDNTLKLQLSDMTWIADDRGKVYCGSLSQMDLLVIYGASTRSIPAMTTPNVVIVLTEKFDIA